MGTPHPSTSVGGTCVSCKTKTKTVTAEMIELTFRSDHLDDAGKKLLRRALKTPIKVLEADDKTFTSLDSFWGDGKLFEKPEWDEKRRESDSHPISHTKNKKVKLDVKVRVVVTPKGKSAKVKGIRGVGTWFDPVTRKLRKLVFAKPLNDTVTGSQEIPVTGLESKTKLPNYVVLLEDGHIHWTIKVSGKKDRISAHSTGPHTIYVTFDKPWGKMESPANGKFEETGPDQHVTETRLRYSVLGAQGTGKKDEKECVDAIFRELAAKHVNYFLGRRWENDPLNHTGVLPKPGLHHYLWLCNEHIAFGECHNIAASFFLACRILGVKDQFEIGYMFPWPSRAEDHPTYHKLGDHVLGKYNKPYRRSHGGASHGTEKLVFLDGSGRANNFEGVAKYRAAILYAIGDTRFDLFGTPDKNASTYFGKRSPIPALNGLRPEAIDQNIGLFDLKFVRIDSTGASIASCNDPYAGQTGPTFHWHD